MEWTALENRGQACTLKQIAHLEANLPFSQLGLDSDNGGEFINNHPVAYLAQRPKPVLFTRGEPAIRQRQRRMESGDARLSSWAKKLLKIR